MNRFRIGTYNLWDGGTNGRWPGQLELLAGHDLDVLCLQEAAGPGWDNRDREILCAFESRSIPDPNAIHSDHYLVWVDYDLGTTFEKDPEMSLHAPDRPGVSTRGSS